MGSVRHFEQVKYRSPYKKISKKSQKRPFFQRSLGVGIGSCDTVVGESNRTHVIPSMVHQGRAANSQLRGSYIPRSGALPHIHPFSGSECLTTLIPGCFKNSRSFQLFHRYITLRSHQNHPISTLFRFTHEVVVLYPLYTLNYMYTRHEAYIPPWFIGTPQPSLPQSSI